MTRAALLAVCVVALTACDTAATEPVESLDPSEFSQDAEALVGTWDLFRTTTAGFGAPVQTASVAGGTETYVFRTDGTMKRFYEGVLVEEAPYDVRDIPLIGVRLHIGTETDYRRVFFGVSEDRFYIDYRPSDGSLLEYRRQ